MPRAVAYLLTTAACVIALACGHEAEAPSARPLTTPTASTPSEPAPVRVPAPPPVPEGAPCVEVDSEHDGKHITLEGRVVVDHAFAHPTRGKTRPFILRLDAPRCAVGIDEPLVTELHLAPGEDVALKPLVGKHVRVSGNPFVAHTAWHARPIVLMTTTVTATP